MRLSIAAAVACLLATMAIADPSEAAIKKNVSIEPQDLSTALREFAQERKLYLIYAQEDVLNHKTAGASGELTQDEVLKQLLQGTGLTYKRLDDNTITIVPLATAPGTTRDSGAGLEKAFIRLARDAQKPSFWDRFRVAQASSSENSQPSAVSAAEQGGAQVLEEVVVTAQKREERLIDVPQAVTVLSASDLEKNGATQFRDFADRVPGLTYSSTGAGMSQLSVRGTSIGLDISPTVRVYVDEVPYGASGSSFFTRADRLALDVGLFDVRRIEVLKGPQGTLYGASAMGGLLKYVTKEPDATQFAIDAQTGAAGVDDGGISYSGALTVNAPLATDTAALRATGFYSHDGGYVDNLATGTEDVDRANIYGARLDLLLTPTQDLSVRLGGFLQNISRDGVATVDYDGTGQPISGELVQNRPFAEPFEQRFRVVSATATYDLGAVRLTSVSSYQTVRSEIGYDLSPFASAFGAFVALETPESISLDKFTQELRFASDSKGPIEWIFGGFYNHEKSDKRAVANLLTATGQPNSTNFYSSHTPTRYEESAIFGDLTYHFTSKFDVTGGMRYAKNRQSAAEIGSGTTITPRSTVRSSENVSTYLANARYHFSDRSTGYVRYATGFRPGGPNFVNVNPLTGIPASAPDFEADELESYEIGFRSETQDRRFGFDLAAYYNDWKDMQAFDPRPFAVRSSGAVFNVPAAKVKGAELSVTARPIDRLALGGSFAYQDAYLAEDAPVLGWLKGQKLPNIPKITGTLSADYTLGESGLQPTVGISARYTDDRSAGFFITRFDLDSYSTVDLRAGLTFGSVRTQLYVRNALDERGELSTIYSFGGRTAMSITQPRTIGFLATTHF